jgi:hypothetical protein
LNNRPVHLPFRNVAGSPVKYGSGADLLLLSSVQVAFIRHNLRRPPPVTISITKA